MCAHTWHSENTFHQHSERQKVLSVLNSSLPLNGKIPPQTVTCRDICGILPKARALPRPGPIFSSVQFYRLGCQRVKIRRYDKITTARVTRRGFMNHDNWASEAADYKNEEKELSLTVGNYKRSFFVKIWSKIERETRDASHIHIFYLFFFPFIDYWVTCLAFSFFHVLLLHIFSFIGNSVA